MMISMKDNFENDDFEKKISRRQIKHAELPRMQRAKKKHRFVSSFHIKYLPFMLMSSADFFHDQLFRKIISETPSYCQTCWTQIRPDILLDLIWVQTVCIGYQQTTLVGKELMLYHATPEITGEPAV